MPGLLQSLYQYCGQRLEPLIVTSAIVLLYYYLSVYGCANLFLLLLALSIPNFPRRKTRKMIICDCLPFLYICFPFVVLSFRISLHISLLSSLLMFPFLIEGEGVDIMKVKSVLVAVLSLLVNYFSSLD